MGFRSWTTATATSFADFDVDTDEDAATLELAGVQEVSLADWLVPPGYLRHASRRMRRAR